jgi:hypothetical protein
MAGGPIVRKPLSVRAMTSRTIDQRIALRFPRLAALGRRLLVRLPPRSRIRQALVWRSTRLGYEAFNRRDFEAVLINYGRDAEFHPPQEAAAGGLVERSYKGHAGFHEYFTEFLSVWGAYTAEPLELIDLGDRPCSASCVDEGRRARPLSGSRTRRS